MPCCSCWDGLIRGLKAPIYRRHGRTVRRARYNEREYSIEFENLIDEEDFQPSARHVLTEAEKELLSQRRYDDLLDHQKKKDAEVDAELLKHEEDLRLEDEAYYRAKKEAAKVAQQARSIQKPKSNELTKREFDSEEFSKWLSYETQETSSPEMDVEDFDAFLEKVKARSLSGKAVSDETLRKQQSWEASLNDGLMATKIAGDALSALSADEAGIGTDGNDDDDDELLLT